MNPDSVNLHVDPDPDHAEGCMIIRIRLKCTYNVLYSTNIGDTESDLALHLNTVPSLELNITSD